jgi:hypothetical protein
MSRSTIRKIGLKQALARRTFVVFVTRERDVNALRSGGASGWTIPKSARPGDRVLVYKPGETAGWPGGIRKGPYAAFVAAGVVYGKPRRLEERLYNAPIAEVEMFPNPVERSVVAQAFPEWKWLRSMRGMLGAEVPAEIESDFFSLIDRLAFSRAT